MVILNVNFVVILAFVLSSCNVYSEWIEPLEPKIEGIETRGGSSKPTDSNAGVCSMYSRDFKFLGTLILTERGGELRIKGKVNGLPKNAELGFHVHEYGNFSDMCDSTGGHFNPKKTAHGCPPHKPRHAGDLGNIKTDSLGVASISISSRSISLNAGKKSILGRALVIHMNKDDCGKGGAPTSHTNGNSGTRIACGAIGLDM